MEEERTGLWCVVQGLGGSGTAEEGAVGAPVYIRVQGFEIRVQGFRFRAHGSGFQFQGSRCSVSVVWCNDKTQGEVSRGERMAVRGTDPESYITLYT